LFNLKLFTASTILFLVKKFPAKSLDELYKGIFEIEWEEIISESTYFTIDSYSKHEDVRNKMFLNVKCKDAIADRFTKKFDKRPDSGPLKNSACFFVRWVDYEVSVFIDTSGSSLSRHQYRVNPFVAPMQESLAAGVVYATGWNAQQIFINPMCGSGTLAIEAALLATKKYPALQRDNFSFMHLNGHDIRSFEKLKKDLADEQITNNFLKIIATDIDKKAIEAAKENARTAGVEELIEFSCCDFLETIIPDGDGVVVFNPPYGERLEADSQLNDLYKSLGDFLKQKCKGKKGFIFTGNPEASKFIGLKPSRRIQFMNGAIECRLFSYELYEGTKRKEKKE
jgi:putative N6-adenine-specific DNA methylase